MGKEGAVLYMKPRALFTKVSRTVLEQMTAATKVSECAFSKHNEHH